MPPRVPKVLPRAPQVPPRVPQDTSQVAKIIEKHCFSRFFHIFSKVCFFPLDVLLDCIFGALRPPLDSSWPLLGTSWTQLGAHLVPLGLHLGGLGRLLASIWGLLGASWGQLGPLGVNFESSKQFWSLLSLGRLFEPILRVSCAP